MTTSNIKIPKSTGPLSLGLGESREEQEKLAELQAAQQRLAEALTKRQALFDPVMLAMAQGFLAPNPSGNFFNSLGNVAKSVGEAQAIEEQRELQRRQLQAELVKTQLETLQQQREAQELRSAFNQIAGNREALTNPLTAGQSEAQPGTQPGITMLSEIPNDILMRLAASNNPRAKALVDIYFKIKQGEREDVAILPDGSMVSKSSGRMLQPGYGGAGVMEQYIPELGGTVKLRANEIRLYEEKREQSKRENWYDSFVSQLKAGEPLSSISRRTETKPPATTTTPSGAATTAPTAPVGAVSSPIRAPEVNPQTISAASAPIQTAASGETLGGRTLEQRQRAEKTFEVNEEIRKAREIELAKIIENEKKTMLDKANEASSLAPIADSIISIASDPRTRNTLGILRNSGILGGLGTLVQDAFRIGNTSIGIGSLEPALRTAFKTPAEIRAAELLTQQMGMLNLNFARIFLQGQGAVSNAERSLISDLGGSLSDTSEGLVAKARMTRAKGEFEALRGKMIEEAEAIGGTVRDIKKTETYKTALENYNRQLEDIRNSIIKFKAPTPTAPAAPATAAQPQRLSPGTTILPGFTIKQ